MIIVNLLLYIFLALIALIILSTLLVIGMFFIIKQLKEISLKTAKTNAILATGDYHEEPEQPETTEY